MMDTNSARNETDEEQVKETDDSCKFQYFEIVPLATDTDIGYTAECGSEDCSVEIKEESLPVVKQEPVCHSHCLVLSTVKPLCVDTA